MGNLKIVLGFGWKYMRPYWGRLVLGIVLGCLCGLTASSFIWATGTLVERLSPPESTNTCVVCGQAYAGTSKAKADKVQAAALPELSARYQHWQHSVNDAIDPWLPRVEVEFDWRRLLGGLLFLPLLALARGATDYFSSYCMGWVSERVINDLRCDVLAKLTSLSLDYFNRSTTGDMLTRVNVDTVNLHRALKQGTGDLFKESFTMVSVLIALMLVDWKLTLIVLVFVPAIILPLFVLGKKARRAGREGRRANVGQNSLLIEALAGIRVLKAFNLEARQTERFREFSKKLIHHGMKGVQAKEMANPMIEIIGALGVSALLVYLFWSERSLPDLVKFITGLAFFFVPIKKIAAVHILFEQAAAGVERLLELLRETPTIVEPPQTKPLKSFRREIVFENVNFSYGHTPVLKNVNLRLPHGSKLGIAGESGSGKSTLGQSAFPLLRRDGRSGEAGRPRCARAFVRRLARAHGPGKPGCFRVPHQRRREHCRRETQRNPCGD